MTTTTPPLPHQFIDIPQDPLSLAMRDIQDELNLCANDPACNQRYRVLQSLYGIVDHTRRVLVGRYTDYQLEKARVLFDNAVLLVHELEEQLTEGGAA